MLIAILTKAGTNRVLNGREGSALPVHHAFRRTDGDWCVCVADFTSHGVHIPFQPWSLGLGDYTLAKATYDGGGWTYVGVSDDALQAVDIYRSAKPPSDYAKRFPEPVWPYVDRIYEDGFVDGIESAP